MHKTFRNIFCNVNTFQIGSLFGVFGLIFYTIPFFFFDWDTEWLWQRVIATLGCASLIFGKDFPDVIKRKFDTYFFIITSYCLCYYPAFLCFQNAKSITWLINGIFSFFLFFLLSNWRLFPIASFIGIMLSFFIASFCGYQIQNFSYNLTTLLLLSLMLSVVGFLFERTKEKEEQNKTQLLKIVATAIAHETKTPLAALQLTNKQMLSILPRLVASYNLFSKYQKNNFIYIEKSEIEYISEAPYQVNDFLKKILWIIDLLTNDVSNQELIIDKNFTTCSVLTCINKALANYPFDKNEKSLISLKECEDFNFIGEESKMIHVIFNIVKNALYSISEANKGNIRIYTEICDDENNLCILDTGKGILEENLSLIFDQFFTTKKSGTGLGLYFCKKIINNMNGEIYCQSLVGSYTKFTISFPKI